ncbi:MAG: NAD(P)/FAD-dependent oxidoreductase [Gemmatimonadota bacterium]
MARFKYLIVGGGMTADAAVRGIRQVDSEGAIGLLSAEKDPPYDRPPLSKKLWQGMDLEKIWRKTEAAGVTMHLGVRARGLDVRTRQVVDDGGAEYTYDRCLLATGGAPRTLRSAPEGIVYFRTLEDYRRLRALAGAGRRLAVLGGGFIGSEIAAALAANGTEVVMCFPEEGIGARIFPKDHARFLNEYYRERGVDVRPGTRVSAVSREGSTWTLRTEAGERVTADGVVAGLGIHPSTELAEAAGLPVDDGIVVEREGTAGDPRVFAAGDIARFHNPALGARIRVEHEDNANTMGMHVGRAMAGDAEPYTHLPFFYSDLFDLGYEAVGDVDARHEIVADWSEPHRKGVLYYVAGGRVRGVLLWNVWKQVPAARALIAERGPFTAADLKGRLPAERG